MVNGDEFDRWLEQQLQGSANGPIGPTPLPARARYHTASLQGSLYTSFLVQVAALATTKATIGLTVGVLAVGAAGAAGEAAITGSANPSDWGHQVVQQVKQCKAALVPGTHGIGQCVSAFASQHGTQATDGHGATGHPTGEPTSHPTGKATSNPTDEPTSNPQGKPTGKPTSDPHGKPSDQPHGKPSSPPGRS